MPSSTSPLPPATPQSTGRVHLVGAGPGDPGLVTVRGVECLRTAQVVVYDYLANPALLAHAAPDAELIYAGKIGGRHNQEQEEINRLLVAKAREGKTVVRLKGGDPFVFGRGGEECEALAAAGIPFTVVPGVTAALGVAATAGIPLTHRAVTPSVAFVTGHEDQGKEDSAIDWQRLSTGSGTVVFYMGIKHLRRNMALLAEHGRSPATPVALVRWGTTAQQEVLTGTLADIADRAETAGFKPPALTIVGEVVNLRQQLAWFDRRPLFGRRILVTRAADQAGEFSRMLEEQGARVVECPTIRLVSPERWDEVDAALLRLGETDWLVLTSANAVRFFFERLRERGQDSRALGRCKVCVVGPKTAEALAARGILADLVPAEFTAEGVVAAFEGIDLAGKQVLFPRADRARDLIPPALERMGARVAAPVLYRNLLPESLPDEARDALEHRELDAVTFSASSTVTNLATLLGGADRLRDLLSGVAVVSIGPITSRTCRDLGLTVAVEPPEATLDSLAAALVEYFTVRPA
ncbi:uroporphyrinogen-III C-methyltransferase [Trichlorobacter ammonificans]|nr:uroporphyrinogen-III C-methyltransferase [Trichlorobacter ammonificans]